VLARGERPYKPSALRGYEADLRLYVLPRLGGLRLGDVQRRDVQALVDHLRSEGRSSAKVHKAVMPLRALFRYYLERDEILVNPTANLKLPSVEGRRERVADASEAAELLAALPESDRALWATAFYAGLRLGELRALRWDDTDLAGGVIRVSRGWDAKEGEIAPKSRKGTRVVPVTPLLRDYLLEHKAATARGGSDFVFGARADRTFTPSYIRKRAKTAWEATSARRQEQGLEPLLAIGLHECRHTYVSLMHHAGFSLEEIGDYVGHSTAYMTDAYRHLLKGHEARAAERFGEYLARADSAARAA
jgi:integrase